MGLDMYLYKKTYVQNWSHFKEEEKHDITIYKGGKLRKDIKPERITYIIETVGYWRKFNALHKWFVDNCQNGVDDCKEYYVSKEKLKELLVNLNKVNIEKALGKELLPTESGFFFGDTEYSDYYYECVEDTISMLTELLKESDENSYSDFYYNSSW
jgi:hypothetical protein